MARIKGSSGELELAGVSSWNGTGTLHTWLLVQLHPGGLWARRSLAGTPFRQVLWRQCGVHICLRVSPPTASVRLPGGCTSISPRCVLSSALDAGSSVFFPSFVKDLALVAASSRVRRRGGVVVAVNPASRRPWPLGRGVHGGRTPAVLGGIGSRLGDWPRLRRAVLPRSVTVGETDEALDSCPPAVELVRCWRVVYEQLGLRESFRWGGGQRRRAVRGAGCARIPNHVRKSST